MRRRIVLLGLLVLTISAIIVCGVSGWGWRLVDICTWKAMIAFKAPIRPVDDYRIVVDKSNHRLSLYKGKELIRSYPVAISSHGLGVRHCYDDYLTPEGEFLIASMQYTSIFGPRQMLLETTPQALADYHAQYGSEAEELIQEWEVQHGPLDTIWEVYDYNTAHPGREIWHDILIHGGGADRDWTLGCIALDNDNVLDLFALLQRSRHRGIGAPVIIEP